MGAPPGGHRVNRVEVELQVDDVEQAKRWSDRISHLFANRVADLLGQVCDELSPPGHLVRVDTLALDLGRVCAENFDEEVINALDEALRAALRQRLPHAPATRRPGQDALSLLRCYALTGNLPWWAARDDPTLLTTQLDGLIAGSPNLWLELLSTLRTDPDALERLARLCTGERFARLLALHGDRDTPSVFAALERRLPTGTLAGASQTRAQVLGLLGAEGSLAGEALWTILLGDLASGPAASLASARSVLTRMRPALAASFAKLFPKTDAETTAPQDPPGGQATRGHAGGADRAHPSPAAIVPSEDNHAAGNAPRRENEATRRPAHQPGSALAAHTEGARGPNTPPASPQRHEHLDTPRVAPRPSSSDATHAESTGRVRSRPRSLEAASGPGPAVRANRRRALFELEELYVDDAGVVILWPFLERFFTRVRLLSSDPSVRAFADEHTQGRAIALLAYVGLAQPEPLEYQLSLAKVLCGCGPTDPVALPNELKPEEQTECEHLLAAVIDHAPVLGSMAIPGFRTAFLQRPGALSITGGHFRLRVEHQPHDPVLYRFAWSWQWIKLPWMAEPLYVDW